MAALAAISSPVLRDSAAATEVSANRTSPAWRTRRLPSRSAEVPADQQQAGEHEGVGVDDPLEVPGRGRQPAADRRQGHVHDRVVNDDEQHAEAQHRQDPPAAAAGRGRPGRPGRGDRGSHHRLP